MRAISVRGSVVDCGGRDAGATRYRRHRRWVLAACCRERADCPLHALLGWRQAMTVNRAPPVSPQQAAGEKAVSRFACHRTPRRCRAHRYVSLPTSYSHVPHPRSAFRCWTPTVSGAADLRFSFPRLVQETRNEASATAGSGHHSFHPRRPTHFAFAVSVIAFSSAVSSKWAMRLM